jgi:hypothetical protein
MRIVICIVFWDGKYGNCICVRVWVSNLVFHTEQVCSVWIQERHRERRLDFHRFIIYTLHQGSNWNELGWSCVMHCKGKGKVYPRTGHERPRGTVDIQLYSFFNPGAGCRWVVNATSLPLYCRGRDPYLLYRGLCGAHDLFGRVRKISSPQFFFLSPPLHFICTSSSWLS